MNRKLKINNQKWKGSGGYHEVLTIAVPLVLSTGTWGIQQFLDRVFLTWYSAEALAAAVPAGILSLNTLALEGMIASGRCYGRESTLPYFRVYFISCLFRWPGRFLRWLVMSQR